VDGCFGPFGPFNLGFFSLSFLSVVALFLYIPPFCGCFSCIFSIVISRQAAVIQEFWSLHIIEGECHHITGKSLVHEITSGRLICVFSSVLFWFVVSVSAGSVLFGWGGVQTRGNPNPQH
jgi:hypothetical protein